MLKKFILPGWVVGSVALFLYSYTQVDLSLTLGQASIFQTIQKSFQYVGYFNRSLSTYLYIGIFAFLFLLYFKTLHLVLRNQLTRRAVWTIVLFVTSALTLSYAAFSHDIFNYIFDARILTHYGQNPYMHKALDFPGDPMLSFMHWTHRTYPYGPIWLVLTTPLTFISGGFFLLSFFLFKALMSVFFLVCVYFIEKIAIAKKNISPLVAVVAFALNPLVLSESLVSAHNDIVMMGLVVAGVYFLLTKRKTLGFVFYLLSVGIKFATVFLGIPAVIYVVSKNHSKFLIVSVLVMIGAVVLASMRTNFQPWYLLYPAPFVALLFNKKVFTIPAMILSIVATLYYVPYLYTGGWESPIPTVLNTMIVGASLCSLLIVISLLARRKRA